MLNKNITHNTLAIICARGGSKGLKDKNLKMINGKPLIYFAINKILKNKLKYKCLSTDSFKIIDRSKKYGLNSFFIRPKKLSTSNIAKLQVWKHALEESEKYYNKKFKYILDIEVTNPLTTTKDLRIFLNKFDKIKSSYNGMFCVRKSSKNPYFNILIKNKKKFTIVNKSKKQVVARQRAPQTYDHVAAMYIFHVHYIRNTNHFLDGKLYGFQLPLLKSIDIDSDEDYNLVKKILKK